jgi:hypothetical protein
VELEGELGVEEAEQLLGQIIALDGDNGDGWVVYLYDALLRVLERCGPDFALQAWQWRGTALLDGLLREISFGNYEGKKYARECLFAFIEALPPEELRGVICSEVFEALLSGEGDKERTEAVFERMMRLADTWANLEDFWNLFEAADGRDLLPELADRVAVGLGAW